MANDPNTFQYVIQEDGFWYIASKDRTPGVPEITVSAMGVANGLSTEYNDGCDFGPDSYNPSITSGVPLTQTSGIQEAWNYCVSVAYLDVDGFLIPPEIKLLEGDFYINAPIVFKASTPVGGFNFIGTNIRTELIFNVPGHDGITFDTSTFEGQTFVCDSFSIRPYNNVASNVNNIITFIDSSSVGSAIRFSNINNGYGSNEYIFNIQGALLVMMDNCISPSSSYIKGSTLHESSLVFIHGIWGNTSLVVDSLDLAYLINIAGLTINSTIKNSGNIYATMNSFKPVIITGATNIIEIKSAISVDIQADVDILSLIGAGAYGSSTPLISNSTTSSPTVTHLYINGVFNIGSGVMFGSGVSFTHYELKNIDTSVNNNMPDFSPAPAISTNPPVSATVYQNTNPYDIRIYLPVYATTSGTAGTVAYGENTSSTVTEMTAKYVSGSTSSTAVDIVELVVPAGHYFEFTGSGVTFGTATVKAV